MPLDPNTDIDEGGDQISTDDAGQDYQDQLERQQVGIGSPSFRSTAPGVYSPTPAPAPAPAPQPQGIAPPPVSRRPPPSGGDYEVVRSSSFVPSKVEPKSSTWSDLKDSFWTGVLGEGKDLTGAAKFAADQLNADPAIKQHISDAQDAITNQIAKTVDGMSPKAQEAMHASILGYLPGRFGRDAQGNQIPTPGDVGFGNYLGMTVAQALPTVLTAILPASIMGKVAVKALSVAGVATEATTAAGEVAATAAARTASTVAGTGTTAGIFGAQNAGAVYNDIADEIAKAPEKDLMASPVYAQLRQNGRSDGEARAELLKNSAWGVAAAAGVGAATGLGIGGRLIPGGLRPLARTGLGAAEGAVTMGVQGGADTAIQQRAMGKDIDLPSVLADAAASGLQGAVMGGVGGLLHGRGHEAPSRPDVGPDEGAALRDQLTPPGGDEGPPGAAAGAPPPPPPGPSGPTGPTTASDMSGVPGYSPPNVPPRIYPTTPMMRPQAVPEGEPTGIPGYSPPPAAAPPATQAAIDASRRQSVPPTEPPAGGAPGPPGAPAGPRPSEGMSRQQLSDALTGQVDPKALKSMSAKDMATRYDRLAPAPETTTVVEGSGPAPPTSEPETAPTQAGGAAPPSPLAGVGSLPVATEAAGTKVPEAPGQPTTTGLADLGGLAKGASENMRQMLWEKFQAGETKEAGAPSNVLMAAKAVRDAGGLKTRADFEQFLDRIGPVLSDRSPGWQQRLMEAAHGGPVPEKPKTAAAIAASKRKTAKGQMAEPGAPVRGAGAVEAEPVAAEVETPAVEQARADRVGDLAEAFRAIPAPRGSALEAVLRKAQRYLSEAVGSTDGTKDGLAELIHNWMEKEPTAPYPGTKVTAKALGEHLMEHAAGQRPVERESARAEIAEVRREEASRAGAESKTITGESIEQAAAKGDEGAEGTSAITPVVKKAEELPDTTDYRRTADALIQKVLNHEMTPAEADARYGKPQSGAGAKRRWPRLADRLRDWIAHAEDPKVERGVLEQLASTQNNEKLTPHQKSTQTKKLTAMLERTGPEFASELREHLRGMEDPVGQAADQARQAERAAARAEVEQRTAALEGRAPRRLEMRRPATTDGISPRSSTYLRSEFDQRIGGGIERAMASSAQHGVEFTTHDAMRLVQNDPLVASEAQPYKTLATRLRALIPNMPVVNARQAFERDWITPEEHARYQSGEGGYGYSLVGHDTIPDHIMLNVEHPHMHGTHLQTMMHEAVHAVTSRYIEALQEHDRQHPDLLALHAMGEELDRHLATAGDTLSPVERELMEVAQGYGIHTMQPHELHTMLLTNPTLQRFAASRIASPEFRARMAELGFPLREQGRSVWKYFTDWVRRSLGMQAPTSASEATFFDHVLRPTQDIVERAAQFNARLLPEDPALRAKAEPLYWAASGSLSDRARDRLSNIDVRGFGDRARRFLLQGATSDGIIARYSRLLPGLENWRDAYEGIQRSGKQFADAWADKAKNLTARYSKLDDPDTLGRLMTDATLAKAHLGDSLAADANKHLATPAEQAALKDLQSRYAKLPAPAKALYNEFRDTYAAWYKQTRSAQLGALVRGFMPDATDAQHEAFTKAAASKGALEKFLKDPDNSAVAQAFGDDWSKNRALARGIAQVHNQGFVQGDYFPLRRFGNYVVRYGDKTDPGSYGVEMFESRKKAELRRAELAAAGQEPYQVSSKRDSDLRDIVPNHPAVAELTNSLERSGYTEEEAKQVRDTLNSILLQHASHSEASRAAQSMRRRGVKGASADQARVLSSEFVNTQVGIGHLEYGQARAKALSDMRTRDMSALESQTYKGHSGDAITAASVLHEVEQRSTAINADDVLQSLGAKANTFSFAQSLMSPSHMLTSSMEAHTNSMALMGARHGLFRTGAALTRALAQASPMLKVGAGRTIAAVKGELKAADWNMPELLKARMIAKGANKAGMAQLFRALEDANLIDHTMLKDIQQQANPSSRAGGAAYNVWARFRDFSAASAHAVDVMNKVAIAKAAFDLEYARTKDINVSVKYATDIARKAMPNYNIGNKARIATSHGTLGAIGSPLFQFKNYGLHMYTTLANLAQEGMHGENKWEARKAFALMLATHAAMAGVLGLPIADAIRYVGGAYDLLTGAAKPHNYENDLRQGIASVFGPELGELISRGLPHAIGIDVHRRVSLSNLLEIPEMSSFDAKGAGEVLTGLMTGATGENLANAFAGFTKFLQGDIPGAAQAMVPRPLRDIMKAGGLVDKGVTTQRGRVLLPPEKLGPGAVAAQALGFQPAIVSEARERSAAIQQARDESQNERVRLKQRWADPSTREDARQEIALYNQDPHRIGSRITTEELLRDQEQRRKLAAQPGAMGLRLPRRGATQLEQAGAFANVQ